MFSGSRFETNPAESKAPLQSGDKTGGCSQNDRLTLEKPSAPSPGPLAQCMRQMQSLNNNQMFKGIYIPDEEIYGFNF
jgi:hypothetical protein